MPPLTRLAIRAALLYLVAAMLFLALPALLGIQSSVIGALAIAAIHLLTVGWLTQLILAVAFWMFPKLTREQPRGDERLMATALILLNVGVLLRLIAEPWQASAPGPSTAGAWLLGTSAVMQGLAAPLAAIALWPRVRGK